MHSDLVSTLNILFLGVLSTLCLWVVWTHRVKTSLVNISLLFILWLAFLFGLDFVLKNPRSLPTFVTVILGVLTVYGMYTAFILEIRPILDRYLPGHTPSMRTARKPQSHHLF